MLLSFHNYRTSLKISDLHFEYLLYQGMLETRPALYQERKKTTTHIKQDPHV